MQGPEANRSGTGQSLRTVPLEAVAGSATETRGSAKTMLDASAAVEEAVANLRSEVEGFLHKVAV